MYKRIGLETTALAPMAAEILLCLKTAYLDCIIGDINTKDWNGQREKASKKIKRYRSLIALVPTLQAICLARLFSCCRP